jgi:hypothetical protein
LKETFLQRSNAKRAVSDEKILKNGYVLLNEIGETVRGEELFYSITVTRKGDAISSGSQVYTFRVPLSEFLTILNFSSSRITLASPGTIYKSYMT